jgi:hypothetical protein
MLNIEDVKNRVLWETGCEFAGWQEAAERLERRPCIGHKRQARLRALVTGIVGGLDDFDASRFFRAGFESEFTREISALVRADLAAQSSPTAHTNPPPA